MAILGRRVDEEREGNAAARVEAGLYLIGQNCGSSHLTIQTPPLYPPGVPVTAPLGKHNMGKIEQVPVL